MTEEEERSECYRMPDNEVAAKATGAENHGFLTDRMAVSQDALNSESAGPLLGFRPVVLQNPPLKAHAA